MSIILIPLLIPINIGTNIYSMRTKTYRRVFHIIGMKLMKNGTMRLRKTITYDNEYDQNELIIPTNQILSQNDHY